MVRDVCGEWKYRELGGVPLVEVLGGTGVGRQTMLRLLHSFFAVVTCGTGQFTRHLYLDLRRTRVFSVQESFLTNVKVT